mgnify:CR=1 FL=1
MFSFQNDFESCAIPILKGTLLKELTEVKKAVDQGFVEITLFNVTWAILF